MIAVVSALVLSIVSSGSNCYGGMSMQNSSHINRSYLKATNFNDCRLVM